MAGKIVKARKRYIAELRANMQALGKAGKLQEASELQKSVQKLERTKRISDLAGIADASGSSGALADIKGRYQEYTENGVLVSNVWVDCKGDTLDCPSEKKGRPKWVFKNAAPGGLVLGYMYNRVRTVIFMYNGYLFRVVSIKHTVFKYALRVHSGKPTLK